MLVVAFLVAAVISGVSIHAHAMWFDELQAWNIARASRALPDLFVNLRYEGHPALWYLPLYALTRVTGDPRAMQVLGWLVVMAVNAVVLFRSPFSVPARLAIVAGYFFAFEYSVIIRSYGLGLLLLVLALSCLGRPRPAWVAGTIALALLAWISLAGAVLAGVLVVVLAWTWWSSRAATTDRAPLRCAIAVVASGIASVLTCIPPADFHSFSLGIPNSSSAYVDPERLARALSGPWRGLMPVPSGLGRWNTNVLDQLVGSVWLQALVSLSLVVVVSLVLRPYRFAFITWIVGTAAYLAFSVIVVLPDRAHYAGEFFLLFLACVWFAYAPPGRSGDANERRSSGLSAVLVVVLAAQIVATVAILPRATVEPFAPDRTLAEAATRTGLARDVVSGQDFDGVTMAGYLDRPVWSIARGAPIRYFVNDEREARGNIGLTADRLVCAAADLARVRDRPVALVVDKPVPRLPGVRLLAESRGVRLYRVASSAIGLGRCGR